MHYNVLSAKEYIKIHEKVALSCNCTIIQLHGYPEERYNGN